jgi:hypothetical protein
MKQKLKTLLNKIKKNIFGYEEDLIPGETELDYLPKEEIIKKKTTKKKPTNKKVEESHVIHPKVSTKAKPKVKAKKEVKS